MLSCGFHDASRPWLSRLAERSGATAKRLGLDSYGSIMKENHDEACFAKPRTGYSGRRPASEA